MRPVQVLMDEALLRLLDSDEEVRKYGRSAVLRRAASEYLRRARSKRVVDAYNRAYGNNEGLGDEFAGWENEATWSEKVTRNPDRMR